MKNVDEIVSLLKGKDIALVGNSRGVLGSQFDVDKHEVVIRMNGAWNLPEDMKLSVGSKLDLLCISGHKKEIDTIANQVSQIMWMSPKSRDTLSHETKDKLFFYPVDWWQELFEIIGSRPSTGCMAAHMISKVIDDGHLTLYGFDFFSEPSWHKKYSIVERIKLLLGMEIYVNPHDGQKEAEFITSCLPPAQLEVVRPE